jgi:ABC-2 type transport system permease protein
MKEVFILLKPRFWSFKNRRVSKEAGGRKIRFFLMSSIGLAFWGGSFLILHRALTYFKGIEGFGEVLAFKLLSMALITFFSLLIFSGILTSLSKLYLSKDLSLVHSMPVPTERIFLARWMESTIDSSWMVFIYSLPVFLSYGIVFKAGGLYYGILGFNILPFCLIASSISVLMVMAVAAVLPAGRIRSIFIFLGLFVFLLLLTSFRLMRPERFARPESFASVLLYVRSLEPSNSPFLPTTWLLDSLRAALSGAMGDVLFHSALSWTGALMMIYLTAWMSGTIYFTGLSKAQTAAVRIFPSAASRRLGYRFFLNVLSGPARAFVVKEIKTFFRDQTQWSQIFLVVALIAIYLYNFSVLPLDKSPLKTEYLQNLISFLNMGLAAFVLAAVSARFVFPAVSAEGDAFWIVKSFPVSIRTFLWAKFFVYFLPLLLLAEILVVISNILLHVTPFMMLLSVLTILFMVPGIVAMGIGLGAIYPDFHSENPAQSVTSLGGLIYMTLCMGFIGAVVVLEAGPLYNVFMTGMRGDHLTLFHRVWLVGSFSIVLALCTATVFIPMRLGEKKIRHDGQSSRTPINGAPRAEPAVFCAGG